MTAPFEWTGDELPEELSGYRILSALKASETEATYLAEDAISGARVIVKTASTAFEVDQLKNERDLLLHIHASGRSEADSFPKAVSFAEFPSGTIAAVLVRSCVEGKSLEALVESGLDKPGLGRETALGYMISVAEKLAFLHGLPEPVIHRDVKPQNVIVDELGACHLIDLGISRIYKEGDDADTRVMGTRLTAPPEQFGFQQTDARSDIYSMGVLIRYCFTGDYDQSADNELDRDIQRIIRRATMFDPNERYQRAEELLQDLILARYGTALVGKTRTDSKKRIIIGCIAAALLAIALSAAAFFNLRAPRDGAAYAFQEPLIEEAVRTVLQKPEGSITYGDLKTVTSLHIFGRQIYSSEDEIWFQGETVWMHDSAMRESGLYLENGGISDLTDIKYMPALRELCLYRQEISDISDLRDTPVTRLGLGYNPLSDLSPLEGNESIAYLNISGTEVSDARILSTMKGLTNLNIGATQITSLLGLEGLPIETVNLNNMRLNTWADLSCLTSLKELYLSGITWDKVYALSSLPIQKLVATYADNVSMEDLEGLSHLEVLEYRCIEQKGLSGEALELPNLRKLVLDNVDIASCTAFSGMQKLKELTLLDCAVENVEGLEGLRDLTQIICSEQTAEEIRERYPDREWNIILFE